MSEYVIVAHPKFCGQEDFLRQRAKSALGANPYFRDVDWKTISVRLDSLIPSEDELYIMQDPFIQ